MPKLADVLQKGLTTALMAITVIGGVGVSMGMAERFTFLRNVRMAAGAGRLLWAAARPLPSVRHPASSLTSCAPHAAAPPPPAEPECADGGRGGGGASGGGQEAVAPPGIEAPDL